MYMRLVFGPGLGLVKAGAWQAALMKTISRTSQSLERLSVVTHDSPESFGKVFARNSTASRGYVSIPPTDFWLSLHIPHDRLPTLTRP